jgi:hypothetical protein
MSEVLKWISLIRIAEAAYPAWSGERMLNSMQDLAGTDSVFFRKMYGGLNPGTPLRPQSKLTQTNIDRIEALTLHSGGKGSAKDSLERAKWGA